VFVGQVEAGRGEGGLDGRRRGGRGLAHRAAGSDVGGVIGGGGLPVGSCCRVEARRFVSTGSHVDRTWRPEVAVEDEVEG
jgi:hypothetical protein